MTTAKEKNAAGNPVENAEDGAKTGNMGGRRRARGGGRRQQRGGVRARILKSLKNVEDGDQLVEGTDVGHKQLEKFMGLLGKLEPSDRGEKLKEKVYELLAPVEIDDGFVFDAEGVNKLVSFLEEEPAGAGRGAGRARGRGRMRGQGAGRGFGPRGGPGMGAGGRMQARRGRGAAAGQGGQGRRGKGADEIRQTLLELTEKVDKLSNPSD